MLKIKREQNPVDGFTFVELLVVLVIATILTAGAYQFFIRQQKSYSTQDEILRLQQRARVAEQLITQAIQQTGAYRPTGGTTISMRGQVIEAASDHYLTLQYDDAYQTANSNVISASEVVTFAVSKETGAATEQVDDGEITGQQNVGVYFDANNDGIVDASEGYRLNIPMVLTGPPYTLYRITPDASAPTGTPNMEAVAANVDDFVLRYYDHNGNPIPRDPVTGAAASPPYVLDAQERAQIRSIEMNLVLRADPPDPSYAGTYQPADNTVGSYSASGAPQAGLGAVSDGRRRRTYSSRVAPRNLSSNSCGAMTLNAGPSQPACPASSTIQAVVVDKYGDPISGATVDFKVDSSSGASLSSSSATTNSNGETSTVLSYAGQTSSISISAQAVVDCSPIGPSNYTLHNAIFVNFVPGSSESVSISGPSPSNIYTCQSPQAFTFSATATDACGNGVDPDPGLTFEPFDPISGNIFGTIDGGASSAFTANGQTFTVAAPTAGPYTAGLDADNYFKINVRVLGAAPAWLTGGFNPALPLFSSNITVQQWPPSAVFPLTTPSNIASSPHDDCLAAQATTDQVYVEDCVQNMIYDPMWGGYALTSSLTEDSSKTPNAPPEQGSVTAPTGPSGGLWDYSYSTPDPACSLEPPAGNAYQPTYAVSLTGPSVSQTLTNSLTLNSCNTACSITASPTPMDQCAGSTNIQVSGCDLDGQDIEFEILSGGGSFDPVNAGVPTTVRTMTGNSPSVAAADLYLGNAVNGNDIVVTASFPPGSSNPWTCGTFTVPVKSECTLLEMFSDAGYSQHVGNLSGEESCLSRISNLYFEVEDCQNAAGIVSNAVVVYAVAAGGAYMDKEYVDLTEYPPGASPPTLFRSLSALPIEEEASPTKFDNILTYPAGEAVIIYAAYSDPTDPVNDDHDPNLTAPVSLPLSAAHDCQAQVSATVPLPVCFPNAITSAGGAQWNGNFNIHWGDVVIMGDVQLPSSPKMINKISTAIIDGAPYSGTGRTDRFFDIYVGQSTPTSSDGLFIGEPVPPSGVIERPFIATGYGNYFHNISNSQILEMLMFLDYDTVKNLAQSRNAYWYTLGNPGATGDIVNPATAQQASLQTVLNMSAPGMANAYHDGEFIFVDTFGSSPGPGPATTGADIDATPTADLPEHSISGSFFTEGIIYIAGSINFGGLGSTTTITARESPPRFEAHYLHNDPGWDPNSPGNLPIRSNPAQTPVLVDLDVNINGAVYADGVFTGSGNPAIFGSITTERGYAGSGDPELWYNYNLNVSDQVDSLCISCCMLQLSPSSTAIGKGDATTLNALNSAGAVQWVSEAPSLFSVNSSGVVTASITNIGMGQVKAVDANNCVARATIEVVDSCLNFNVTPATATIDASNTQLYTANNPPPGTSISWASNDPGIAAITSVTPATGLATGQYHGQPSPQTTIIKAIDTPDICPDPEAFITVNDAACLLNVTPAADMVWAGGASTLLTANAPNGSVSWTSTNPAVASVNPAAGTTTNATGVSAGLATVTATDSASCTATASVAVCDLSISVNPVSQTLTVGDTAALTASGSVSGSVNWTCTSGDCANITIDASGGPLTAAIDASAAATVKLTATDANAAYSACTTETTDITFNAAPVGWTTLSSEDFESGWGDYSDLNTNNSDCTLYSGGSTFAHQGNVAANIRDNSGDDSAFELKNSLDLDAPGYTEFNVEFWYKTDSMENGENFLVQFSSDGGSSWTTMENYVRGTDFNNGSFYQGSITITEGSTYVFSNDVKIRFECSASNNNDNVYIDEIVVKAK